VLIPIDPTVDGNASAYTPVFFKRLNNAKTVTVTGENITVKKGSPQSVPLKSYGTRLYLIIVDGVTYKISVR